MRSQRFTRYSLIRASLLTVSLGLGALISAGTSLAVDVGEPSAAPATQPAATQPAEAALPVDPATKALIAKLGDDDPAVRNDASRKLTEMGKGAVPALRQAAESDDPEVRSRAKELLHHIERHLPPPGPPQNGMMRRQSMRSSMNQGIKTVDVDDNGRQIHIVRKADGSIDMSVTGVENGKEATETYQAKDAEDLKKDNPEAFAIYDQWAGDKAGFGMHGGVLGQGGVRMQIMPGMPMGPGGPMGRGGVLIVPNGPPNAPAAPGGGAGGGQLQPQNPQDLQRLVEQQQKEILELQARLQAEQEQRVHEKMRGQTGKESAPADGGNAKPDDNPGKPDGKTTQEKPAEKPTTRP